MLEKKEHTCVICGKTFTGWGNNPYPVKDSKDGVCCDFCNNQKVIPARVAELYRRKRGY